jgi:hypothetical protein
MSIILQTFGLFALLILLVVIVIDATRRDWQ